MKSRRPELDYRVHSRPVSYRIFPPLSVPALPLRCRSPPSTIPLRAKNLCLSPCPHSTNHSSSIAAMLSAINASITAWFP